MTVNYKMDSNIRSSILLVIKIRPDELYIAKKMTAVNSLYNKTQLFIRYRNKDR